MTPAHTMVSVTRDFAHAPGDLFAHWTSPKTRPRWEGGPESEMRCDGYDVRSGGREVVRIIERGEEIGQLIQSIHLVLPGDLLATSTLARFGGQVTQMMQTTVRFERTSAGTRLHATCQITDLKGRDQTERHRRGWDGLLDRFTSDIDEHGITRA